MGHAEDDSSEADSSESVAIKRRKIEEDETE
jgi:hypothetical protein